MKPRGAGKVWPPLVLDHALPLTWDDAERVCSRCKVATHWRTPKGRATHPNCEASIFDELTTDALLDLIFDLKEALGAVVLAPLSPEEIIADRYRRFDPIPFRLGPCSWCGRPGIGILDDRYSHCARHLWHPHRWPPEEASHVPTQAQNRPTTA